jgi:hypothetical protein
MKADIPLLTHAPKLDVPAWVSEPVAQHARTEYAAEIRWAYVERIRECEPNTGGDVAKHLAEQDEVRAAYAEIVREDLAEIVEDYRPLVSDPQMRGVWRELSRPRNGAFLHPARAPSAADAKERQAAAMVELFDTALECQRSHEAITTRGKAEQQRRRYLARAEELERDALTMVSQPLLFCGKDILSDNRRQKLSWKLDDAADAYKEYARAIHTAAQFSMPEREHDGHAHWVALMIGGKFRDLFGSPMYGLNGEDHLGCPRPPDRFPPRAPMVRAAPLCA